MVTIENKLQVLAEVAGTFNAHRITWAIGSSLLLYCKGIVEDFHDIDIMVTEEDGEKAGELLNKIGVYTGAEVDPKYDSRVFRQYDVQGVELDLIGGFCILENGVRHDCDLRKEQIRETIRILGEEIPLMELRLWMSYYTWMERPYKAEWIHKYLEEHPAAEKKTIHI